MRTAFVTGGSGFLGKQLILDLCAKGVRVHALARSSRSADAVAKCGAIPVQGDLQDVDAMAEGMQGCDVCFHCASSIGVNVNDAAVLYKDNVTGAAKVLAAAEKARVVRFIYISSCTVIFDGSPLVFAPESTLPPLKPLSHYSDTKLQAEALVHKANADGLMETIIIRLPLVWGAGDSLLPGLVRLAHRGLWVWPCGGKFKCSSLHVINASYGIIGAGEGGRPGEIYHLCDDETPSFRKIFRGRLVSAGCKPWMVGDKVFSRNFPGGILDALAICMEFLWGTLRLKGAPPLPREGILISNTDFSFSDQKARDHFGYHGIIDFERGLQQEAEFSRRWREILAQ